MTRTRCNGQSTIEFALLIAVVVAAFVAIQFYLRNALEGRLRQSGDQIGSQWDARQGEYTNITNSSSTRHEVVLPEGTTTSTIMDEKQTRDIDEKITASQNLWQ